MFFASVPDAKEQDRILYPRPLSSHEIKKNWKRFKLKRSRTLIVRFGVSAEENNPSVGFMLRRNVGPSWMRNRCKRMLRHAIAGLDVQADVRLLIAPARGVTLGEDTLVSMREELQDFLVWSKDSSYGEWPCLES